MCTEREKVGRGVAYIPLKTMAMHVAYLTKLVRGTEGHMSSLFARFWIGFALRSVIPWKGTSPWSTDRPWHYQKVAEFIRGHPWCLVDGLVLDHRKLYKRWRDCWAAQSGQTHPQMPRVEWASMQPNRLDGASKDLHLLRALRRLPVGERLYRHGINPTPLCPIGCGGEETVKHALWSCPVAARFWRRVSEWWSAEEGADIDRDLVLYGRGLKRMGLETGNPLWQAVSVAKLLKPFFRISALPQPDVVRASMEDHSSDVLLQDRGYLCRDIENTSTRKTASVHLTFSSSSRGRAERWSPPMITASHAVSRRERSGSGSGSRRQVAAEGERSSPGAWLASSAAAASRLGWYPGAGVNETGAGRVLARGLGREAHGVGVLGE
ncbi:hypothetical protein QTP86_001646 [Hemibagrus guttatus]|nr:hypothetical protein QTP86_001646 [Hemibagrus guttatus]